MSAKSFYSAFENRHRGSRALIKQRLKVYLPFVEPLLRIRCQCRAVDLGCGRGEWLELLRDHGFEIHGVDLDEGMLFTCEELGLPVAKEDAIEHLKSIDDNSQCIVSGFHIAEHLAFSDLQALVTESLRVLKPGGLLILETPNPENIVVGTVNFHLDPTHNKPLPPELLTFLAEHEGFKKVKVLRLQEPPGLLEKQDVDLIDVLGGASPDFSIIAQKQANARILQQFGNVFDSEYGVTLGQLAERYDSHIDRRFKAFEQRLIPLEDKSLSFSEALSHLVETQDRLVGTTARAERAEATIEQQARQLADTEQRALTAESRASGLEQRVADAETRTAEALTRLDEIQDRLVGTTARAERAEATIEQQARQLADTEQRALTAESRASGLEQHAAALEAKVAELNASSHHWWLQAQHLEQQVQLYANSRSWRYMYPLRATKAALTGNFTPMASLLGKAMRYPMIPAMKLVLRRPELANKINRRLLRYPRLRNRLLSMARESGVWRRKHIDRASSPSGESDGFSHLSPRARQIYHDLKAALERNGKEAA